MLNLSEFSGHFFEAPYEIRNIIHLRDNIVDEIIFYATGFGWASSPHKYGRRQRQMTILLSKLLLSSRTLSRFQENRSKSIFASCW